MLRAGIKVGIVVALMAISASVGFWFSKGIAEEGHKSLTEVQYQAETKNLLRIFALEADDGKCLMATELKRLILRYTDPAFSQTTYLLPWVHGEGKSLVAQYDALEVDDYLNKCKGNVQPNF